MLWITWPGRGAEIDNVKSCQSSPGAGQSASRDAEAPCRCAAGDAPPPGVSSSRTSATEGAYYKDVRHGRSGRLSVCAECFETRRRDWEADLDAILTLGRLGTLTTSLQNVTPVVELRRHRATSQPHRRQSSLQDTRCHSRCCVYEVCFFIAAIVCVTCLSCVALNTWASVC